MKIALLALMGAFLGALGGGAFGIVAGIGWIELFRSEIAEAPLRFMAVSFAHVMQLSEPEA